MYRSIATANVTQTKTSWSSADLAADYSKFHYTTGKISYDELHAGSYNGSFNLAVNLNYTEWLAADRHGISVSVFFVAKSTFIAYLLNFSNI